MGRGVSGIHSCIDRVTLARMTRKLSQKYLRASRTYLDLWENAKVQHDLTLPEVKIVSRPWGSVPKVQWGVGYARRTDWMKCGRERGPARYKGETCQRAAGAATWHPGVGACSIHGGNGREGTLEGVLIMSCAYASFYQISPPEALQQELERTVGAVRWLDEKLAAADSDEDILPPTKDSPGGKLGQYTELRIRERGHLVRVATSAITAGVTEIIGERMRAEGARIAALLSVTLDRLELDEESEGRAREILADQLRTLAIDSQ